MKKVQSSQYKDYYEAVMFKNIQNPRLILMI